MQSSSNELSTLVSMSTNESYYSMPYNSRADAVRLLAERYDTKSNVKLGGFRPQLIASYVSSHTEALWNNETVCMWMTIYIYIYIYSARACMVLLTNNPKICKNLGAHKLYTIISVHFQHYTQNK